MFKKAAILGLAAISLSIAPAYADGVFSKSNLRIGNVNLSISNDGKTLTKTDANTGKWLGEQTFVGFKGMMWVPEANVLLVSAELDTSMPIKIKGLGGGGRNMFALQSDGRSINGYNYRLGSQRMKVESMSYKGNLQLSSPNTPEYGMNTTFLIKGLGGTGDNMFALQRTKGRSGYYEDACKSMDGYNYLIQCIVR
jgi:hypothetical protein